MHAAHPVPARPRPRTPPRAHGQLARTRPHLACTSLSTHRHTASWPTHGRTWHAPPSAPAGTQPAGPHTTAPGMHLPQHPQAHSQLARGRRLVPPPGQQRSFISAVKGAAAGREKVVPLNLGGQRGKNKLAPRGGAHVYWPMCTGHPLGPYPCVLAHVYWPMCSGHPLPMCTGHPFPMCTGHPLPMCTGCPLPMCAGHPLPMCAGHPLPHVYWSPLTHVYWSPFNHVYWLPLTHVYWSPRNHVYWLLLR